MRIDPHSDHEIWEAAARTFAPIRPRILRFLARRVHDHHAAEDLTQETLLRGMLHARKLRHPRAATAWLLRIAWHVALDWHRRRMRRGDWPPTVTRDERVALVGEPCALLEQEEERRRAELWRGRLREGLGRLGPLDRVLLIGYHFVGLGCQELALRSGLSRDSVKQRLCRARRRLRAWVDEPTLDALKPAWQRATA